MTGTAKTEYTLPVCLQILRAMDMQLRINGRNFDSLRETIADFEDQILWEQRADAMDHQLQGDADVH